MSEAQVSDKVADKAVDKAREARIDKILQGAVDPHVHSGPSIAPRAVDHLDLIRQYSEAGFAAALTKDHDYAGVATAQLITKHHPELKTKIFSGVVLNNVVGGMNPYAVEHTAAMGGKTVWMPTFAAENHLRWEKNSSWVHPASTSKMRPASAVPVLDANKNILDSVKEVLDVIAKNDMLLASGHIHVSETWLIFEEAKKRGVNKLCFTHPEEIVGASLNDVKGIAAMGAFRRTFDLHVPGGIEVQGRVGRRPAPSHRGRRRRPDRDRLGSGPGRRVLAARRFPARRRAVHGPRLQRRRHP